MPGIVGFTYEDGAAAATVRLRSMLAAVKDHESYSVEEWVGDGIALGRVALKRASLHKQPIWNEAGTHCIVFEGELFDSDGLQTYLSKTGRRLTVDNAAELLLHLFEQHGAESLAYLNGSFNFAIWHARERTLTIGNDRFGLRHLYYSKLQRGEGGSDVAFACGVRGLLADDRLNRSLDYIGISQGLHFEHLLADRTYVENAKLLMPAHLLSVSEGHCVLRCYHEWQMTVHSQPQPELHNRRYYLDTLLHLMQRAVARHLPDESVRSGINLSGGLDSRMLLGVMSTQTDVRHLRAFTFGTEGSDDVRIARMLARKLGIPHQALPLPEDYLMSYAQMGARITDGMDSCIHIHSLANLDSQAQEVDLIFTGYYSDALADTDAQREWFGQFDDETSLKLHWSFMHRLFVADADETIFSPDFLALTKAPFDEEFRSTTMRLKHGTMLAWLDAVELAERQRRLTQFGNDLLRWRVLCRTPFTDADFVDFCLALPPGLRLERFLFTQALIHHFPALAKVPNDRTGRPFIVDMRHVSQQALFNLRYILYRRGLAAEPRHRRRLYAYYDRWFRTALRPWVEDTLLDKRTLQRGILQPAALQRIVQEHMSGAVDRTRELGMLLSLELWLRNYMD